MVRVLSSLIGSWLVVGIALGASDLDREQRLVEEFSAGLFAGEVIELDGGTRPFAAIDTEAEGEPRGAVVLLHGRGFHADWPEVTEPLRTALAEQGWRTLSLQMPVLGKEAKYYDYVPLFPEAFPRIEAGVRYLRELGHERVVLVAHSCGVHMAMAWIGERGDDAIDAFVGIGMGATDYRQPMRAPFPLDAMSVPVLDVYGADEYNAVIANAPRRLANLQRAGHPRSSQEVVPGADHYFKNGSEGLIDVVGAWLDGLD